MGAEDGPRVRDVSGTIHNLGTTGPGDTRASELGEVCKFCHTPHRGSGAGLNFNKRDTEAPFVIYDSPSMDADVGPPLRETRLCLSCHDGTIALGDLLSEEAVWDFPAGREHMDPTFGGIEPMLRDDHPVSFDYDADLVTRDGQLVYPDGIGDDLPLSEGRVECTTCHKTHDNTEGFFMRFEWSNGAICERCHVRSGWDLASHRQVSRPDAVRSRNATRLGEPAEGCRACHRVHFAELETPLQAIAAEEEGCYACHSADGDPGNPGAVDVMTTFALPYRHPVEATMGVHEPGENPYTMPTHVTCADCHNPHATRDGGTMDAMVEMRGIDVNGLPVDPATEPQQVCYPCHGLAPEPTEDVPRYYGGASIREQFGNSAVSAHPVDRDASVGSPSLRQEWQNVTRIGCEDCHNAPQSAGYAEGPHGSTYSFILERNYRADGTEGFTPPDADLCDKCHDVAWIIGRNDPFKHEEHADEGVLCSSCHAAHGVTGGPVSGTQHLINFDLRVVEPFLGVIEYVTDGSGHGTCTLLCHGEEHDGEDY